MKDLVRQVNRPGQPKEKCGLGLSFVSLISMFLLFGHLQLAQAQQAQVQECQHSESDPDGDGWDGKTTRPVL